MKISIGIDVSKSKLNVCCYDGNLFFFLKENIRIPKKDLQKLLNCLKIVIVSLPWRQREITI